MMTVVIGGSGSGKSAYAEDCLMARGGGMKKFYIATMQVFGEEGKRKVDRHRQLRAGKGFVTIERQTAVEKALEVIRSNCGEKSEGAAVLLECMSNLVANEMFSEEMVSEETLSEEDASGGMAAKQWVENDVVARIVNGITQLKSGVAELVIVTNNVFEDGCTYDDSTMEYIRVLGEINRQLATMADEVVEVVVGIPVTIKRGN